MKEALKTLSDRITATLETVCTEEATKNAYVMPFIQMLGYDVFNPLEVVPEFTADVGLKQGEKVDYAIMIGGSPAILIECKDCRNDLSISNAGQLFRYFHTTRAKFGILTNGIFYRFYTDLQEANKMDSTPFLEIDLRAPDKIKYSELEKFSKACFDAENIRRTAELLKCTSSIRQILKNEFSAPSSELVRMIFRQMDCSAQIFNDKQKEKLTPLVKAAIEAIIRDEVKAQLDAALKTTAEAEAEAATEATKELPCDGIVTTDDETAGWNIIRAILHQDIAPERVAMRDAKSYCAILYDDNNRRPICRLYFNNPEKRAIGLFDTGIEDKVLLTDINALFNLSERLKTTLQRYLTADTTGQ